MVQGKKKAVAPKTKPQKTLASAGFYPMLAIVLQSNRYHVRAAFPLHYIVFKQTASHLPHEGNSEQLFSRAGGLSDDNGKMDPARLAVWTSIGVNYSTYKPTDKQILERYTLKFRKGGTAKMHEDDLGLFDPDSTADGDADDDDDVYVQVDDE